LLLAWWAAQQRTRHAGERDGDGQQEDAEVGRALKSLLNKLTLERFAALSQQIMAVPMTKPEHVQLLIKEIFEKATTQHQYIDMYANLCVLLHGHLTANPVGDASKFSFKRLLLNECQASFERNLGKSDHLLKGLDDPEEKRLQEFRHKSRMLGNMKLIGALLVRKMLAGKVFLAILAELLSGAPSPEALESVAALLTVAGAMFDTRDWAHHATLEGVFDQLQSIIKKPSCNPRVGCLLKDVLDLRARRWQGRRCGQSEAPSTLKEVVFRQAAEEGLVRYY